jgi:quaternary ammonium compound-resistance protein SugE
MSSWSALVLAGLLEIVWATALKASSGFSRPGAAVLTIVAAGGSFALLGWSLRALPVGVAYAVWTGIGAAGVAVAGAVLFAEPITPVRVACILMILGGVLGLHLDVASA